MSVSTITKKGQTTVPKEIRDFLHLEPGDKIAFTITSDGAVVVMPVTLTIKQLKGIVRRPAQAVSLLDMEEAIAEGASRAKT